MSLTVNSGIMSLILTTTIFSQPGLALLALYSPSVGFIILDHNIDKFLYPPWLSYGPELDAPSAIPFSADLRDTPPSFNLSPTLFAQLAMGRPNPSSNAT